MILGTSARLGTPKTAPQMEEYELCRDGKPLRGTVVKLKIEPTFLSQTLPLRDAHRNCN